MLTAHPTEARRRAVASASRRISEQLDRHSDPNNGPAEQAVARRRLTEELEVLWGTELVRSVRPSPLDEVHAVLTVFDSTLARVVPRLYRATEVSLGFFATRRPASPVPAFVRFGSWVGGDRDGNPFVTAGVTRAAVGLQAEAVLRMLEAGARRVASSLTMHEKHVVTSAELGTWLAMQAAAAPLTSGEAAGAAPGEPHRHAMLVVAARVAGTRVRDRDLGYATAEDLVSDLRMVQASLAAGGAPRAPFGELQHLLWQVQTFGFHLAELEVRQHSRVHEAVLTSLLSQVHMQPQDSVHHVSAAVLDQWALNGWPARCEPTDDIGREVLATFRVMATLQQQYGRACCGRYIVSFTRTASDLAAVRALARLAVGDQPLHLTVVPLFETYHDLRNAASVLEEWVALPGVAAQLEASGRRLEVMVGYSDSAKDVGPTSAALTRSHAQTELIAWARRRDVHLTIFHGRGGSLGRGGGPLRHAILAQPPGSVAGRYKVTEQGEVIAARYANPVIGQRHLERITEAVLQAEAPEVTQRNTAAAQRFTEMGARLEAAARSAYRDLVTEPGFADFMAAVTPLDELGQLRLGSRPPKRAGALVGRALEDLRAIPWVFAWSQARLNLAGWFGLGSGLAEAAAEAELHEAWREWPLFRVIVDMAEMSLAKTHRQLAEQYLHLGDRPDLSERILTELDLTTRLVLATV